MIDRIQRTFRPIPLIQAVFTMALLILLALYSVPCAAGVDDYPSIWKSAAQDSLVDSWGEYNRECTSFVAYRLSTRNSFNMSWHDNASGWGPDATTRGCTVNMTPAPGAVAWWSSLGHVAWVEAVNGTNVTIEEYNYIPALQGFYSERTISANSVSGYIHFKDIVSRPNPIGSITSPSQDGTVVHGPITISGTAVDTGSPVTNIQVSFDNSVFATVTPPTAAWSVPFSLIGHPRGTHTITLTVTDQAGISSKWSRIVRLPAVIGDYDGDGKTDVSVFRPSQGMWYVVGSTGKQSAVGFGQPGDIPVPGDYDGDGKTDMALFRPSNNTWYVLPSSGAGGYTVGFGNAGDIPVPADYDGDGKTDMAVFRPSEGKWYILYSSGGSASIGFGQRGDIPVPADYDGDGKADFAVFRPSQGMWYVVGSTGKQFSVGFGQQGDIPVPADYDGDGKADFAVFRPSQGMWYVVGSTGKQFSAGFGQSGDVPVPGDFDGDGKADMALFRPWQGMWYVIGSSGRQSSTGFGQTGDLQICYFLSPQGL